MPPKGLIDAADKTGNNIPKVMPYLISIFGAISIVSGAMYLSNSNYKR
jgi:hypothetical protein